MAGIFISYRREDTGGAAGRLYDRLRAHFGANHVFRDLDTIEPGVPFPRAIQEKLSRCDVLIALIGDEWLAPTGEGGQARVHAADDFVRIEIATAMERGIPVIPTLIGRAGMPRSEDLPRDLVALAHCQAITIDDADFHDDVTRLISFLGPRVRRSRPGAWLRDGWRRVTVPAALVVLALTALAVTTAVVVRGRAGQDIPLRHEARMLSADEVRAVIVGRGFFSAVSNPAGRGIQHAYRQEVLEGVPVVADDATGLMWQQAGSGRIVQGGRSGAADFVRGLNGVRHAGHADWRLPTLEEALSLMTPDRVADFHLPPAFSAIGAPFIWTADSAADAGGWVVYYLDGITSVHGEDFNGYVRAVRSD